MSNAGSRGRHRLHVAGAVLTALAVLGLAGCRDAPDGGSTAGATPTPTDTIAPFDTTSPTPSPTPTPSPSATTVPPATAQPPHIPAPPTVHVPPPPAPHRTTPPPAPRRTTPAPPPRPATDPRFSTCAEAKAHGYGPYRRGIDPEYDWYRDADHDGIDCE